MPATPILTNVRKVEFWAVLPSGFLLILILLAFVASWNSARIFILNNLQIFGMSVKQVLVNPIAYGLLALFASYLAGSFLSNIPIRLLEKLRFWKKFDPGVAALDDLKSVLDGLKETAKSTMLKIEMLPDLYVDKQLQLREVMISYWKDILCLCAPECFDYYQSFEAKTRYFCSLT